MAEVKQPVKTGELCFQFDNDEPIHVMDVNDYNAVNIQLKHPTAGDGMHTEAGAISFTHKEKTLRLFIKPTA